MGSLETGNIISKIRKEKNMTQKELAKFLNVSDKAVSKWERGESYPDVALLPILAKILNISIDELLSSQIQTSGEQEASNNEEKINTSRGQISSDKEAYKHLIEDYKFKFDRNWFFIYFSMILALLTGYLALPFGLHRIIPVFLPLFILGLFYFIDKKYQITINRLQNHVDYEISKLKSAPYYQILIFLMVQSFVLYMMGRIASYNNIVSLNIYTHSLKKYIYTSNTTLFFVKIFNYIALWILFMKYREYLNKFNKPIFINLIINFLLSIVVMIVKVSIRIANPWMEPSLRHSAKYIGIPNLITLGIALIIVIFMSYKFLKIKNLSLKGKKILFSISLLINTSILIAYRSVEYILNTNVNICNINAYSLRNIFLIYIIIYFISVIIYEKSKIKENA